MKTKLAIIAIAGVSFWYSSTANKKYNNISNKLDMIISVSKKGKIDSLEHELMILGGKLDSMTLKYDYNFDFTN
tara:strand:+ start:822 stop:1043 length:222 start_codon:yes stop_codon:yes gene_type:complete